MNTTDTLLPDAAVFAGLTAKQREVLDLLTENRTTKEIATQLGVSDSAVNQRIDPLRQRLGGITRAELTRRYRSLTPGNEPARTCEVLTDERLQVEFADLPPHHPPRDDRPGRYRFEDSLAFASEPPWDGLPEPRVVPRLLDGRHAGLARGIAIMVMMLLIVACLVLGLTAAQVLTDTLGNGRPAIQTSQ